MDLQIVTWKIRGVRPLMQSNYYESMIGSKKAEAEPKKEGGRTVRAARLPPFDEAKSQLYNGDDGYWHPYLAFWRAMLDSCVGFKIGGTAASSLIPKIVFPMDEEKFLLYTGDSMDDKKPKKVSAKDWQMDSRRVVNEKRGGLIAHRPKWASWGGFLCFEVDMEPFKEKKDQQAMLQVITSILNVSGKYGIGTGRMKFDQKTKRWGGLGLGKFTAELV